MYDIRVFTKKWDGNKYIPAKRDEIVKLKSFTIVISYLTEEGWVEKVRLRIPNYYKEVSDLKELITMLMSQHSKIENILGCDIELLG